MYDDLKNEEIIVEIVNLVENIEAYKAEVDAYCEFMREVILNTQGLN